MRGGADVADQVIEDQRVGCGARVIRQDHVGLIAGQRLDVGDAQFFGGHAQLAQAEVFAQGVVFAVTGALDQRFDWRCPVIDLLPDAAVVAKTQLLVEEAIDRCQLVALGQSGLALQHLVPRLNPSLRTAQWAIALFGSGQDVSEIPVRPNSLQPWQQEKPEKQPSAEPASGR